MRQAFRFAFELGLGFRTYLTRAAPLVLATVIALHFLSGREVIVLSLAYGIGRGLFVALSASSGGRLRAAYERKSAIRFARHISSRAISISAILTGVSFIGLSLG